MRIINNLVTKIRNGLFLAASRSYGEQYIEPLVRKFYGFNPPAGNDHDAVDKEGNRYEIKACKVLKATGNGKSLKTIIDRILFENTNLATNRLIPFTECMSARYLANVQNVKRDHFDYLIYVLLFSDCVKIFMTPKENILLGALPGWSDKHGRYDELGKSGQFPVTERNIKWHLEHNLKDTLTYESVTSIFEQLSNEHVGIKHNDTK